MTKYFDTPTTIEVLGSSGNWHTIRLTATHEKRDRFYDMVCEGSINPGVAHYTNDGPTAIKLTPNHGYDIDDVFDLAYGLALMLETPDWITLFSDWAFGTNITVERITVKGAYPRKPDLDVAAQVQFRYLTWVTLRRLNYLSDQALHCGPNIHQVIVWCDEALECFRSLHGSASQVANSSYFAEVEDLRDKARLSSARKQEGRDRIDAAIASYKNLAQSGVTFNAFYFNQVVEVIDAEMIRLRAEVEAWRYDFTRLQDNLMPHIRKISPTIHK